MYFMKPKKQLDQQECKEQLEKEKIERQQKDGSTSATVSSPSKRGKNEKSDNNGLLEEELPDGACFRPKVITTDINSDDSAVRPAEYIGSFSVSGTDQDARVEFVQKEMDKMRQADKSKRVMLVISLSGVKVCSSNGESVYMAHALKRISYATCEPDFCQFSFLAREPKGHINSQFCHVFLTKTSEEAEELNTLIGNAFKMAYAQQRVKQPTFNELIEKQLVEQKQKFQEYQEHAQKMFQQRLTDIATPTPFSEKAIQHMEMRRQSSIDDTSDTRDIISGKNKLWYGTDQYPTFQAKHQVDRARHKRPGLDSPQGEHPGSPPTTSPPRPLSEIQSTPNLNNHYSRQQSEPYIRSPPTGRPQSEAITHTSRITEYNGPKRNSTPQASPVHQSSTSSIQKTYENNNNNPNKMNRSPAHQRICSPGRLQNGHSEKSMKGSPVHQRVCSPRRGSPTRSTASIRSSYDNVNSSSSTRSQTNSRNSTVNSFAQLRFDNSNNSSKGKGSPVTALKDAIDRGFLNDGHAIARDIAESHGISIQDPDGYLQPRNSKEEDKVNPNMVNRPLPAIPKGTNHQNGHIVKTKNWTSLDDDVLTPQHRVQMRRDNMKDSPRRRQPRPHSEVFSDHKFVELDGPGCYMYGSRTQVHQQVSRSRSSEGQQHRIQQYSQQLQMQYQAGPPSSHMMKYQNGDPLQEEGLYEYADDSAFCDKNRPGLEALMGLDRSHIQDETLRHASWYQAGIPREIALEILQQEDIGSFIVRDSTTHPGCYALSVRVPKYDNPTGISHYLILKTQRGVKLKGLDKEWPDLLALVTHHTVMPEMLPCTLRLPHKSKNPTYKDNDKDEKDEDPDYQRLSDFTSMMEALKK